MTYLEYKLLKTSYILLAELKLIKKKISALGNNCPRYISRYVLCFLATKLVTKISMHNIHKILEFPPKIKLYHDNYYNNCDYVAVHLFRVERGKIAELTRKHTNAEY